MPNYDPEPDDVYRWYSVIRVFGNLYLVHRGWLVAWGLLAAMLAIVAIGAWAFFS